MEIGLTKRMSDKCRLTKLPAVSEENLFYCWDINIDKYKNRNILYMSNCSNNFGCIICGMKPGAYKNIEEYAVLMIKELLLLYGYSEAEIAAYMEKAGPPALTKTHGRKVIGVMTRSLTDFFWSGLELNGKQELQTSCTLWLNHIVGRCAGHGDGYYEPCERFLQDMKASGINVKMDDYHVIVRIVEDDYGCEEREEGAPDMAMCLIASMDGTKREWYRIPERVLAEHHLDVVDQITPSFLEEIKA